MRVATFILATAYVFASNGVAIADWTWHVGDSTKLRLYGWSQGRTTLTQTDGVHSQLTSTKLRFLIDRNRWHLLMQTEFVNADAPYANWLQELHVSYDVSDTWQLTAGRFLHAAAYITPPPFLLETAKFPRTPFPLYAYGLRGTGKVGEGTLRLDLTGYSNASFQSDDSWDRIESSGRLEWPVGKLTLAATARVADELGMYAADVDYRTDRARLRCALWSTNTETGNDVGAYAYAGWRLASWVELHGQVDALADQSTIATGGVRLFAFKELVSLTADYQRTGDNGSWLGRLQWRF